jgi:hypothetical protein
VVKKELKDWLPSILIGCMLLTSPSVFGQLADSTGQAASSGNALNLLKVRDSPHKATIYAAVLPGLGQIYNKKYWKVPILYAGIGCVIYAIQFNSTYYEKYRSAYRDFLIMDPANTSYEEFVPVGLTIEDVEDTYSDWFESALESKRTYYKRYRDISYFSMFALYLVQIIDATVDSHLKNFEVSDDLSFNIDPVILPSSELSVGGTVGFQMRVTF